MTLTQKIDHDLKQAMIAKDEAKLSTIRMLKSALKYAAIEKKAESLSDADVCQLIQKQIKQRRESIAQFTQGGRKEMAEKEAQEAVILEAYLPKQLSDEQLKNIVEEAVKNIGASSKKDFGRVMKVLAEKLAGQADGKRISDLLGKILS